MNPAGRFTRKPSASAPVNARHLAMHRLSVREYGSGEMRSYLRRKGVPKEEAALVVDELVEQKLIDDERYARVVARHQAFRDKGPAFVMMRLQQKGVRLPRRKVEEIFKDVLPETAVSEVELARQVIDRRYPLALTDRAQKAKAYGALARRGFSRDAIMKALVPAPEENANESAGDDLSEEGVLNPDD